MCTGPYGLAKPADTVTITIIATWSKWSFNFFFSFFIDQMIIIQFHLFSANANNANTYKTVLVMCHIFIFASKCDCVRLRLFFRLFYVCFYFHNIFILFFNQFTRFFFGKVCSMLIELFKRLCVGKHLFFLLTRNQITSFCVECSINNVNEWRRRNQNLTKCRIIFRRKIVANAVENRRLEVLKVQTFEHLSNCKVSRTPCEMTAFLFFSA